MKTQILEERNNLREKDEALFSTIVEMYRKFDEFEANFNKTIKKF